MNKKNFTCGILDETKFQNFTLHLQNHKVATIFEEKKTAIILLDKLPEAITAFFLQYHTLTVIYAGIPLTKYYAFREKDSQDLSYLQN